MCCLCVFFSGRPRFVSKKVIKAVNFIKVEVFKDNVVVDLDSQVAYTLRASEGDMYIVKKFNPKGKDIRGIDASAIRQDRSEWIQPGSDEYKAVMAAYVHPRSLNAYGFPGDCLYPTGYVVE